MRIKVFILFISYLICNQSLSFSQTKASYPQRFFDPGKLTEVGVYYYPEHWDESQWERDFANMKALGFDFVHLAEFAWAHLEPEEGIYTFEWLDKAVSLADKNGLKVIMCTSTATPPVWLLRKHPDIAIMKENGMRLDHGARQHPSFSNTFYREYSLKMIEKLAQHYGPDKRIMGWQLDNEPRPAADYSEVAQQRFRDWLKTRYQTIDKLNKAWGTAFWSQVYSDFSQINIPQLSVRFMNPHQILDYQRFITDETVSFLDDQARIIRKYASPDQWITSNYIPEYGDGHLRASKEQDFPTYTRYQVFGENLGIGPRGYRLSHVERIAMANDFFRPVRNLYGVMELQPGQVNWGQINPQPLPGAVRLWLWHVFAGGSKFTCTYRFRAPIYGIEMYHYGIVDTDGITPTRGGLEFKKFIEEIKLLRKAYNPKAKNNAAYEARRTAILYHHENTWDMQRNKQTTQWNTINHVSKYYDALKSFGCPVDFIEEQTDFNNYKVIIAPAYQLIDSSLVKKWTAYVEQGGNLILSCRTGHKNRNGQLWEAPFAAPIYGLIGSKIDFYDLPLPETPNHALFGNIAYPWTSWGEILLPDNGTEIWGTYEDDFYKGSTAITFRRLGKGTVTYVGVDSQEGKMEKEVLKKLYSRLSIPVLDLPDGLHIEYRDGFGIAVNYADKTYTLPVPENVKYLIGDKTIPTAGVSVWVEN